jgi:exopolysaccharide biosynthesis polyprenyl glycosylphosphotransferase
VGQSTAAQKALDQAQKKVNIVYPRWQLAIKRALDLLASALLLIVISPLLLFIALWIRLDSPGPIIFKQIRVGLHGKPYTIYKFRTMVSNADELMKAKLAKLESLEGFTFQEKDDPRITPSGRFLRKMSFDELPQLLNIMMGTMSMVGPRPEVPDIVKLYTPEQRQRLQVLPGVTGLAQVNGRSELNFGETMSYDLEYVHRWSVWLDIAILWKTLFVVLTGKGAY